MAPQHGTLLHLYCDCACPTRAVNIPYSWLCNRAMSVSACYHCPDMPILLLSFHSPFIRRRAVVLSRPRLIGCSVQKSWAADGAICRGDDESGRRKRTTPRSRAVFRSMVTMCQCRGHLWPSHTASATQIWPFPLVLLNNPHSCVILWLLT